MNAQFEKFKKVAIFLSAISTASIPVMAHADWSIKGLGTLGGASSEAFGINDSGQVVGILALQVEISMHLSRVLMVQS